MTGESEREYGMTRRLPRQFDFEGGPTFWRDRLIHIVGGAVLHSWSTEGNGSSMVYRQPVNDGDTLGRAVYVITEEYESIPVEAGSAIAQAFSPDDVTGMAYLSPDGGETQPLLLLSPIPIALRRPGKN